MKKILIIDDDKSFLISITEIFKNENFDVCCAESATECFVSLGKNIPDLVMLDINLPDKNGFDVLKYLKANKKYSNIPVIMITGDNAVQIDKAFDLGAEDCFFKPINMEEIIKKINEILKNE